MIPNNNLSILPFYDSVDKQNHRKDYAFGDIYPLLTPDRKILPFQIIRETQTNTTFSSILLKKLDGSTFLNITSEMQSTGLVINKYASDGYDIIKYPGIFPMAISTPEGQYYLQLNDGYNTYYSDVFNIVRNLDDCLKITYWDNESLEFTNGRIDYTEGFKFNLYLRTQVGRPEYEFEEQVEERDGYSFMEKQISEKTYKFNFISPEYLLDAMRIIRMSDNVQVVSKGENYEVDTFLITPTWQDGGYLASVEAEFQCDTIIKKIGRSYVTPENGDFNNDFNNDFDNT